MRRPWLYVVGIGPEGPAGLTPAARALLAQGRLLAGAQRLLDQIPAEDPRPRLPLQLPLDDWLARLLDRPERPVCVLATGDPMWFGLGATLRRSVAAADMIVVPSVSAFQLAAAEMRWPLAGVACLSLHGRDRAPVLREAQPGQRLLILGQDDDSVTGLARDLTRLGLGASPMTLLVRLGFADARIVAGRAADWQPQAVNPFHVIAVICEAERNRRTGAEATPSRVDRRERPSMSRPLTPGLAPGLADEHFRHDGQITKRDMRAITLAALAPRAGDLLWDIGTGSGSVAIEWLRAHPDNRAVALDQRADRVSLARANAEALGVSHLQCLQGQAPEALTELPPPQAVFLGGAVSHPGLLAACWQSLTVGGRLVANAVTLAGEAALLAWHREDPRRGELVRLHWSRSQPLGDHLSWKPARPLTQWRGVFS